MEAINSGHYQTIKHSLLAAADGGQTYCRVLIRTISAASAEKSARACVYIFIIGMEHFNVV